MRRPSLAVAAVLTAAGLATAQDKPTLTGAYFGPPIVGPVVEPTGLKGHPVVVEMWGAH
jgi:hypothetical protein